MTYPLSNQIRPSQVTGVFGPGSIYDNQIDSMIIMGLNRWKSEEFHPITEELLLREIRKNTLKDLTQLVSISSHQDPDHPGQIPVKSFPIWGYCSSCKKLQKRNERGLKTKCISIECTSKEHIAPSKIFPVRYVAVCANGHLDEFPWYRWAHRTEEERNKCPENKAQLYLINNYKSLSLDSTILECRNHSCGASRSMGGSLSKNGLRGIKVYCSGRRPWLDDAGGDCTSDKGQVVMQGIFKGATNMYFPLIRRAVTIPRFGDELAQMIYQNREIISTRNNTKNFDVWLEVQFRLKTTDNPEGRWTSKDVKERIGLIEKLDDKMDIRRIEFGALDSGDRITEGVLQIETLENKPASLALVKRGVLAKSIRIVSAVTGFTRLEPFDPNERRVSPVGKGRIEWLPVSENIGEGIFMSFQNNAMEDWQRTEVVRDRFSDLMTIPNIDNLKLEDVQYSPKYIFLHTLSHMIIRSIARNAGYTTASLKERIYCDKDMAGILIYTASSSSDGSLGGLTGLGNRNSNRIWRILEDGLDGSATCSCDPLCSMQEAKKMPRMVGAACHACTLLPETCCESMNNLLDRELVVKTLRSDEAGFFKKWTRFT
ncbi:conserved hypothetical protein [Cenarchaeum symbiosum A]|uniref:MrfA-like Zn-binding domain-containing protein n=1 Tax=Cenarchaeum symbiosum (strain A) TaxID=414004 RepID=A0RY29_CENSY|nr:conserved hypothetical protein [Cenarchaeum symbiosum A]